MQQSPLKTKQYNQLQENKRDILTQLQYLFTYYASKSSRHNYRQLTHKFFLQMLLVKIMGRESDIKKRQNDQKDRRFQQYQKKLSIIYYSKGIKQGLTFSQFLNFIPNIAVLVYDSLDKQQATKILINDLRHLCQTEVYQKLSGKIINLPCDLDPDIKNYINKLLLEFNKIYKAYFPHEFNNNLKNGKYEDQSLKCYFEFLKDFEILPRLLTAGQAYLIFREIIQNKDWDLQISNQRQQIYKSSIKNIKRTQIFTLYKFIGTLIVIGENTYKKLKQYDQNDQIQENKKEMFKTLLEYIQMTKAYKKQRHLKQTNQSFSFIILQQYPKQSNMKTIKINNSLVKEPRGKLQFMDILKNIDI